MYKLADIFNVQNYSDLKNVGDIAYALENDNRENTVADVFSVPYYCSNDDWDINQMTISKIEHLDRKQINNINKEYIQVTNKSIKCANDICSMLWWSF